MLAQLVQMCPCLKVFVVEHSGEECKSLLMAKSSQPRGNCLPVTLVRGGSEAVKHGAMVKRNVQLVMSADGKSLVYSSMDGARQHLDAGKTIAMSDIISISDKYKSDEHPLAFAINAEKLHIFDASDATEHDLWVRGLNDEVQIYKHNAGVGRIALLKGAELQKQGMLMKGQVFLVLSEDGRQFEYCPPSHMHGLGAVKTISLEEIKEVIAGPPDDAVTIECHDSSHRFHFASEKERSAWHGYISDEILAYSTKKQWQQAKQKAMEQTAKQMVQQQKAQRREEGRKTQDRIRDKYKSGKR
jgi:hypothetical protein